MTPVAYAYLTQLCRVGTAISAIISGILSALIFGLAVNGNFKYFKWIVISAVIFVLIALCLPSEEVLNLMK